MGGLQDVTVAIGCLKSAVTGVKKIFIKVVIRVKWILKENRERS